MRKIKGEDMNIKNKKVEIVEEKEFPTLETFHPMFLAMLILGLGLVSQGYCADNTEVQQIEAVTKNVMDTIFSPWARRMALVFGAASGTVHAWAAASPKPFLVHFGLGLTVNYIPKIIELIVKIGG